IAIDFGAYVGAGDRFEKIRPGYAAVRRQLRARRDSLAITGTKLLDDGHTLCITTAPQSKAFSFAAQIDELDLGYDQSGVDATWQSKDGANKTNLWLPHADLEASRTFTTGSAEHDAFWPMLKKPGTLTLRAQLDLWSMLRPLVQPGGRIGYTLPAETVTVTFD